MTIEKGGVGLDYWKTESLRLTAFTTEAIQPQNVTWWRDLLGEEPDSTELKSKQGVREDKGIFEDNTLTLITQPNRIDWIYSRSLEEMLGGIPVIGSFSECLQKFSDKMNEWLKTSLSLSRLAFGAVLLHETKDRREGYSEISKFLTKVELDPDGSCDFMYRINRPRKSLVLTGNDTNINRLSKWSVARLHSLYINFGGNPEAASTLLPGSKISACRLELDISTDQNFSGTLPKDLLDTAFSELLDIGEEIARKGDI